MLHNHQSANYRSLFLLNARNFTDSWILHAEEGAKHETVT